ncbi:glycine zipper domain-containing protein [Aquincola sp. MAHUQ-54]|uniref:Glycine zipper domain-containing protein n=1 Tax=Aquincola agrisoli TaxID=3119538 RepID=A0AAW9QD94_9BURK
MNEHDQTLADKKSHPVATGTGAVVGGVAGGVAGGAAAGAAVGGMTGPVGAAVGAVVGAVAGAMAGKGMAKAADPAVEDAYWRDNYSTRPYVSQGSTYDDYGPAYGYGVDAYTRYPDRSFDDLESDLSRDWGSRRGTSKLEWETARPASRDAWQRLSDRVERAIPGDSDRDGR